MEIHDGEKRDSEVNSLAEQARGLALFGDSIANGLGVAEKRFGVLLADALGLELLDYSGSAMPVSESLEAFKVTSVVPVIAIIAHGATEAIIRPQDKCLRFLPTRWRRMGWMDPRPYYSRRWRRKLVERIESALRWRIKNFLMGRFGGQQLMSAESFAVYLEELIILLRRRGTSRIIVVCPPDLYDRYFPGSPEAQVRYFEMLSTLDIELVDLKGMLARWSDFFADRFHPNIAGHSRIAKILHDRIRAPS